MFITGALNEISERFVDTARGNFCFTQFVAKISKAD